MANSKIKLAVLPGDGIGREVTEASLPVFKALQLPIELTLGDIGWPYWQQEGTALPERTWQLINQADAVLLGATTSKPQREASQELAPHLQSLSLTYLSPIIQLRQKLDLFANVRPCFNISDKEGEFNFCIIRENTEGLYAGFDYYPLPKEIKRLIAKQPKWQHIASTEISCTLRLQTKQSLKRLFEFAFQYATDHGMKRVSFADKPNVLRESAAFARDIFESVASCYPQIDADILNVDAIALWLVKSPERFGVIVCENMFGDILSDLGAGIMGGLGLAPSANIGQTTCYFEPVHGSAPRIGANKANPAAMFLTISMLLEHFSFNQHAQKIKQAVKDVINDKQYLTYDLGGKSTTKDMANAIIARSTY